MKEGQKILMGGRMEWDVISTYSRAQAIEDGVLIDVTEQGREAGFKYPVAVTSRLWAEVLEPSDHLRRMGQSEMGRLHDVFTVLKFAIRQAPKGEDMIFFHVKFGQKFYHLKSVCGPGDNLEPVITIMMANED